MRELQPGRHRHYKGREYTVLGVARHSETEEPLVVYRKEYGDHGLWVRPLAMFLEDVIVEGRPVPRFAPLGPPQTAADNLFHNIPERLPEELFTVLRQGRRLRIERIVSQGHASPPGFWYDQPQAEWVLLAQGSAVVEIEGGDAVALRPGSYLYLAPHVQHRVASTDPLENTIWLAVHELPGTEAGDARGGQG